MSVTCVTVVAHMLQFPAIYEEPIIRMVHHSTLKLDDLSGRIAAHFRDSFVCGEEVLGTKDTVPTPCRVVAVHEAASSEGTHTLYTSSNVWLFRRMQFIQVHGHGTCMCSHVMDHCSACN